MSLNLRFRVKAKFFSVPTDCDTAPKFLRELADAIDQGKIKSICTMTESLVGEFGLGTEDRERVIIEYAEAKK